MKKKSDPITVEERKERFIRVLSVVILFAGWEALGRSEVTLAIPPLSAIFKAWIDMMLSGEMISALLVTLKAFILGFFLAVVVGVATGVFAGRFILVDHSIRFFINFFMSSPMVVLIPIIMLLFGIDYTSRIIITFLFGYFVIAINALTGVQSVDPSLIEMAESYCTSQRDIFFKIIIPNAIPEILAGIRLGLGRSILGTVVSEVLMALTGLGGKISYYGNSFISDRMLAVGLTIMLLSVFFRMSMSRFERRVVLWKYRD